MAIVSFSVKAMAMAFVIAVAIPILLFSSHISAELPRLEHSVKSDGSLSLLVLGDWGRNGDFNQSLVAAQVLLTFVYHHYYNVLCFHLHPFPVNLDISHVIF